MEVDQALRLSTDLNSRALELARQLVGRSSPETIFEAISKGLQELVQADIVWLQHRSGQDEVQLYQSEEVFEVAPLSLSDSPCRQAVERSEVVEVHSEWGRDVPTQIPLNLSSMICHPVTHDDALVVVCAGWRDKHPIVESERRALDLFAKFGAIALQNAARYDILRSSYYGMVHGFLIALEVRDFETIAHSRRVVTYTKLLADRFGFSQAQKKETALGAALHDVGKIGIPDHILRKPSKLTEEEFQVVRTHPLIGYRMLQSSLSRFPIALDLVRHHHERFDGKGYPDELGGSDISTEARTLAVADAFDVMTTARPYKRVKSIAEAREEIALQRGTQFCPEAVDAFLSLELDLLEAVRRGEVDYFPFPPPSDDGFSRQRKKPR